jgi:hypothetical protein
MLTIRAAQMEALARERAEECKARLRKMAARCWPEVCARLGDAGLRACVDDAFAACIARGIEREDDLARYLNIALALGPSFEADPRYPWARRILDDTSMRPAARIERLSALTAAALRAEAP